MAGELAERIGHNIRAARIEAGLKQRELAQKIADPAASNTHVSEWERGVRKPSDRYMPLVADALGKDVAWFYTDHEHKQPDVLEALALSAPTNGDGDVLARLAAIEGKLDQLASRLEVGLSEQQKLIAAVGDDYFTAMKDGLAAIASQLSREADQPPGKQARGQDRSTPRAA